MIDKKLVIIVTIIAIILISGIVCFCLNRNFQEQYTFIEKNVDNVIENNKIEENILEKNEFEENIVENIENENNIEEEIEENKISNNIVDNTENDKKVEEEEENNKQKAIDLVKEEWGKEDNTVYYYVEEQVSDNIYIISVRDQATTQDLSTYKVNISSESIEKN